MANKKSDHQSLETGFKEPLSFPDDGEFYGAAVKKSETLIFFCHFFQGHKRALKRHIQFVNELGFDAYAFNLQDSPKDHYWVPYSDRSQRFGMKHALADQIEDHLDLVMEAHPKRDIIVYAFSNVAGCAIECMSRRTQDWKHVKGLICDSGPGSEFFFSSYKLAEHQIGIKSLPLRLLATPLVAFGWSPSLNKDIITDLREFPEGFPVLSIRGWKDQLIAPKHIDKIFDQIPNLKWKKLSLPEAGHLNGLRDFPNEYKPPVADFLSAFI